MVLPTALLIAASTHRISPTHRHSTLERRRQLSLQTGRHPLCQPGEEGHLRPQRARGPPRLLPRLPGASCHWCCLALAGGASSWGRLGEVGRDQRAGRERRKAGGRRAGGVNWLEVVQPVQCLVASRPTLLHPHTRHMQTRQKPRPARPSPVHELHHPLALVQEVSPGEMQAGHRALGKVTTGLLGRARARGGTCGQLSESAPTQRGEGCVAASEFGGSLLTFRSIMTASCARWPRTSPSKLRTSTGCPEAAAAAPSS